MAPRFLIRRRSMRLRAVLAAVTLAVALPANSLAWHDGNTDMPPYVALTAAVTGGEVVPLINSGETAFGDLFQGIPDGLGIVPIGTVVRGVSGTVDIYVAHEQSHVPFGVGADPKLADYEDSSVTRVRVDIATKAIVDMQADVIPDSAGFLRFCSAFMAGPAEGFGDYTFFVNEESNEDILDVPAGAPYGPDPAIAPHRQAGYSVFLDTATGEYDVISRAGRLNHENTVVVPGGWNQLAMLTGDDTFSAPGSQLYLYTAKDDDAVRADKGQLWAFQVTTDDGAPVDPLDAMNGANDYLDISVGEVFAGKFIHVPTDIARGVTDEAPQAALENWSNANNVFQFIRVEDVAYDPDGPRAVYFADTGASVSAAPNGRMMAGGPSNRGRIFKMVLNARDPRIVDSLTVLLDATTAFLPHPTTGAMIERVNRPDNVAISHNSLMVQEDTTGGAKVWRYDLVAGTWSWVATAAQTTAETSGIIDASAWLGDGWWALDVQSHVDVPGTRQGGFTWVGPPSSATGAYFKRLEDGQLLVMKIPGS